MSKIGLFFGPEKGSVHRVAEKIAAVIGEEKVELVSVNDASVADLEQYDQIIFGISTVGKETWDSDYSNTDWSKFFPEVSKANYDGKVVAIYGLGDHVTYPDHFVNAIGRLAKELKTKDANIVGSVDPEGYEFEDSEALIDGRFIGLPIDEDFEPEQTDERIANWLKSIQKDFGF
ncbi:flavodoxin [Sunxiuqinia elliptica]|uniref:Flavodoxin n=1 Tax=Sunxiuqinia elliptica TaxID=655355 RepID=A0A4V3BWT3_9BACT|nr:flavodoxin [Sunxiuqinia elliptica]TDN96338.1 flavodoxin I [Sunxiuqinia elliptica]TDO68049.1 flavodoxin I [Sunxiuqinia elliptica]